jgi:uncharacterized protein YgbK (DUF1537 family)
MPIPIAVIADDLTGAAEIAGVALRHGLSPQIVRDGAVQAVSRTPIVDTDSRLLPANVAAATASAAFTQLRSRGRVFKKIDSLLRGPVVAEIEAALAALDRDTALLVSHNPSLGRRVVQGVYRVNEVELHRTPFRHDPEYPRLSADVRTLLGDARRPVVVVSPKQTPVRGAINVGCAGTADDVRHWADVTEPDILPVGGVDFFTATLASLGCAATTPTTVPLGWPRLIVSGSASAYARSLPELAAGRGVAIHPMPADVFAGSDELSAWADAIATAVTRSGIAVVHVGHAVSGDRAAAQRIQRLLSTLVRLVLERVDLGHLFVDGGATAAAVIRALGWTGLAVRAELAVGVVTLEPPQHQGDRFLTLKPGSYAWPDAVWLPGR